MIVAFKKDAPRLTLFFGPQAHNRKLNNNASKILVFFINHPGGSTFRVLLVSVLIIALFQNNRAPTERETWDRANNEQN